MTSRNNTGKNESARTVLKSKSKKSYKKKANIKIPCIYCFHQTKSRDAICLGCKIEERKNNLSAANDIIKLNEISTKSSVKTLPGKITEIANPEISFKTVSSLKTACKKKHTKKSNKNIRFNCTLCSRRTRCADAICLICKTIQRPSSSTRNEVKPVPVRSSSRVIKLQSIIITPASTQQQSTGSYSSSLGSSLKSEETSNYLRAQRRLARNESRATNLSANDPSTGITDLENLLSDPDNDQEDLDNYYVSVNDINQILEQSNI